MRRRLPPSLALALAVLGLGACGDGGGTAGADASLADAGPDAAPRGQGSAPEGDVVVNEVAPEPPVGPDWIELANRGATDVDLSGWFISDAPDRLDHFYQFPAGSTLAAGAYVIVWADGGDPGDGHHAPFQLSNADGVVLLGPTGLVQDNLVYLVHDGAALQRMPDREGLFFADPTPTPGTANQPEASGPSSGGARRASLGGS